MDFQPTREYHPIHLSLEENRVIVKIVGRRRTVQMIRTRRGGAAFQTRTKIRSATGLVIDLLQEARIRNDEI